MKTPSVSVIVPNYNHARFLRQRLDTILAQTYQDFELILLDDCSTDESRRVLSEYASDPRVTHVEFNETNSGSTFKQWNKGARVACGKYVWIAESDDYADPRLLEVLVSQLDADASVILAQCRTWRVSADGKPMGFQDERLPDIGSDKWTKDFRASGIEECRKHLRCFSVQNSSSIVFRRDVYWRVGGADDSLRQCGDWKTWVSMALTGGAISYVAEPLNYRRNHDASVTEKNLANPANGVLASESLYVTAWILSQITPDPAAIAKFRDQMADLWIPAVRSAQTPPELRAAILRNARSVDPHAYRKLARSEANKLYYRLLDLTYAPRHALGLYRGRASESRAKSGN